MDTSFLTDGSLLKFGFAIMLFGIVNLIYVKYMEKNNPNPSRKEVLRDFAGYGYREYTFISQVIIGLGWLAVLSSIVVYLLEWLGWI